MRKAECVLGTALSLSLMFRAQAKAAAKAQFP